MWALAAPNKILNNKLLISAWLLLSMLYTCAHAEDNPSADKLPLDTVVIMDSSGSMKQNDPKQLRKPAAKLFISLLDSEDRLSVVSFSSKAWPITYLTQLESE